MERLLSPWKGCTVDSIASRHSSCFTISKHSSIQMFPTDRQEDASVEKKMFANIGTDLIAYQSDNDTPFYGFQIMKNAVFLKERKK